MARRFDLNSYTRIIDEDYDDPGADLKDLDYILEEVGDMLSQEALIDMVKELLESVTILSKKVKAMEMKIRMMERDKTHTYPPQDRRMGDPSWGGVQFHQAVNSNTIHQNSDEFLKKMEDDIKSRIKFSTRP